MTLGLLKFLRKMTQYKHRWTSTLQDSYEFIKQNCQQKQVCEQQHFLIRLDSLISITFTHLLPQESRFTHSQHHSVQWTQPHRSAVQESNRVLLTKE